ncbi:WD40-repeat-containing domain protein [Jimgerdemannia flammicorona]|uniref:DNA damage-binding protein CMR1 n=1 Tax=Jimgerdemannia flammicorona TaxID=994334 RepID=A0A433QBV2_9FUNG|nr:WD40-repeat-containing domain protein [Jimgerdemannia flammicorona]
MEPLSEYEQQRVDNIKRNKELLRDLHLEPLSDQLQGQRLPQKQKPKRKPEPRAKDNSEPRRTSARLRNLPAPSEIAAKRQATEETLSTEANKKRRRVGDLKLEDIETKLINEGDNERFAQLLQGLLVPGSTTSTRKTPVAVEYQETNDENARPTNSDNSRSSTIPLALKKEAQNLKIRHTWSTVKVVPERIYCSTFYPSADRLLGVAGDTTGNLGFWDIHGTKEQAEAEPVVFAYRPHSRAITGMMYSPTDSYKLFTSSYDGSVRCFDMNKTTFTEAFVVAEDQDEYAFTWIDSDPTGNQVHLAPFGFSHWLYFCTDQGEIGFHDLREPLHTCTVYNLIPSKTKCLNLNPVNPNLLVTSSNDKTIRIWDIRKMRTAGATRGPAASHDTPSQLYQFEHGYSVTSAYWSPDGKRIVSTGYDDLVKIFAGDDQGKNWKMEAAIPHNNQTRKWVTMFRATWSTNTVSASSDALAHPYFCIGNMKHPVDIYSGVRGDIIAQLYDVDHITAVPAVANFHPRTPSMTLLCGNASGRMVCFCLTAVMLVTVIRDDGRTNIISLLIKISGHKFIH